VAISHKWRPWKIDLTVNCCNLRLIHVLCKHSLVGKMSTFTTIKWLRVHLQMCWINVLLILEIFITTICTRAPAGKIVVSTANHSYLHNFSVLSSSLKSWRNVDWKPPGGLQLLSEQNNRTCMNIHSISKRKKVRRPGRHACKNGYSRSHWFPRVPSVPWPSKCSAYLVILCFERRHPKQNTVARLKSWTLAPPNPLVPPKFLSRTRHWE